MDWIAGALLGVGLVVMSIGLLQRFVGEGPAVYITLALSLLWFLWNRYPEQWAKHGPVWAAWALAMASPFLLLWTLFRLWHGTWDLGAPARWKAARTRQALGYEVQEHELGPTRGEPLFIATWVKDLLGRRKAKG